MNWDQVGVLLLILLAVIGGLLGIWWGRKQSARRRGLDERYHIISNKSQAVAWKITLAAIYILFILIASGVKLSAAPALGIVLFIHLAGWAFSNIYYNVKL
ncbi:hypothetical protein E0485_00470 [Paenibacillus albiflavus]|uniref:DUF2178 domain-containing protein n=1 Tax=Paenibacillus albiflavus TaxID=2545760 RepID=A0A4R4EML8_9BACL|nr:hypothetical protein [Paenibacillus albiflavus]TCZ80803.1 hypothetical protein E0485_00470 [Paenibacillus albiflavus]